MAKIIDGVKVCSCGTRILTKSNYCNYCARLATRKSREERLAKGMTKQDVYNYEWRVANPKSYLLQSAKSRAKAKGIEFDISCDDFEIPDFCPALGIPLVIQAGKGTSWNSPSLDRIDSKLGYIKGNIQVLSWRANHLKSDGTVEEIIKLAEFLKNGEKG